MQTRRASRVGLFGEHVFHLHTAGAFDQQVGVFETGIAEPCGGGAAVGETEIGMIDLFEVAADEDDLVPGVSGEEVDDGAMFVEA